MPVLKAISNLLNHYRQMAKGSELDNCSPDDLRQIACDLGLPVSDLQALASGSRSPEQLGQMLAALRVNSAALADAEPAIMRDLQRVCCSCTNTDRCRQELAAATAAGCFHEFCPNAHTLDAVRGQTELSARH